jgi:pseudolysin
MKVTCEKQVTLYFQYPTQSWRDNTMKKFFLQFVINAIGFTCINTTFAATPINLDHKPTSILQTLTAATTQTSIKQTSSNVDINQTTHIRFQQFYAGHLVWGADGVAHIPQTTHATLINLPANTTMNGTIYQNLTTDLNNTPTYVFSATQADKAFQHAVQLYQKKTGVKQYDDTKIKKDLIVYLDKNNKAHWAYFITFRTLAANGMLALPTYIIDAISFTVYEEWNNLKN